MTVQQKLLTMTQVRERFPVAPSRIYELMLGGFFPSPIKVGRRSLWLETDINQWIASIAERRDGRDHLGRPVPVVPVSPRFDDDEPKPKRRIHVRRPITLAEMGKATAKVAAG